METRRKWWKGKRRTWSAIRSGTKNIDASETEFVFRVKYDSGKETAKKKIIKSNEIN